MCKPGNAVRMLGVALMCVAGLASADTNCDATVVAELTTSTLMYAEECNRTLDHYGIVIGGQSSECQLTRVEAEKQYAEVLALRTAGCTTYYAGPSRAQLARLSELGDKFSALGR